MFMDYTVRCIHEFFLEIIIDIMDDSLLTSYCIIMWYYVT